MIAGKLRLLERIALGAMGEIWRARHLRLEKDVAVKLLRTDQDSGRETVQRFIREAQAASRLNHPNSVSVLDFGEDGMGSLYLAMEFISGPTLAELISLRGHLPMLEAADIAAQILAALAAAHGAGILHRDIKPSNILLLRTTNDDGDTATLAKLCDFGLAKFANSADTLGGKNKEPRIVGTPLYMSPEQAVSARIDASSDLYSVGVVLFEMLTGRPPFEAERAVSVLMKHCAAPVPRASDLAPQLPTIVDRIIAKAMSKRREDRFHSARSFRNAVLALGDSKPISGSHTPLPEIAIEPPIEAPPVPVAPPRDHGPSTRGGQAKRENADTTDFDRLLPHMRLPDHEARKGRSTENEPWFLWERYALSPHRKIPPRGFWLLDAKNHRVGPLTFDELALALRLEAHDGGIKRCLVASDPRPSDWQPALHFLETVGAPGIAQVKASSPRRQHPANPVARSQPVTMHHAKPGHPLTGPTNASSSVSVLLRVSAENLTGRVLVESSSAALPNYFEAHVLSGSPIFVETNDLALQTPSILTERGVLEEHDLPLLVSDAWIHRDDLERAARRVSGVELHDHHATIMHRRLQSLLRVEEGTWTIDDGFEPEPGRPFASSFALIIPRLIADSLEVETMEEALLPHATIPVAQMQGIREASEALGFTSKERTVARELLAADNLDAALPSQPELRKLYVRVAFALVAAASSARAIQSPIVSERP